jgi:hypothetical protein
MSPRINLNSPDAAKHVLNAIIYDSMFVALEPFGNGQVNAHRGIVTVTVSTVLFYMPVIAGSNTAACCTLMLITGRLRCIPHGQACGTYTLDTLDRDCSRRRVRLGRVRSNTRCVTVS